jgi:hypothetical protein
LKVINGKDYDYVGRDHQWYIFKSKPKDDFDPEIIYVTRARYVTEDGKSIFYDLVNTKK